MKPDKFFSLKNEPHASIFDSAQSVWDIISLINQYLEAQPLGTIQSEVPKEAYLLNRDKIFIGKNCLIEPGAYIEGPCYIGDGTQIRHGAYVRKGTVTSLNCVIGHASEVKNSLLLSGAKAAHFAYVGDSILGHQVNLGAGTKLANLRFDKGFIYIHYGNQKIATNLKKFGAIIGDYALLGCNSVTNPGTLIMKNGKIAPNIAFGGVLEENKTARFSEKNLIV